MRGFFLASASPASCRCEAFRELLRRRAANVARSLLVPGPGPERRPASRARAALTEQRPAEEADPAPQEPPGEREHGAGGEQSSAASVTALSSEAASSKTPARLAAVAADDDGCSCAVAVPAHRQRVAARPARHGNREQRRLAHGSAPPAEPPLQPLRVGRDPETKRPPAVGVKRLLEQLDVADPDRELAGRRRDVSGEVLGGERERGARPGLLPRRTTDRARRLLPVVLPTRFPST